jgi:hypothetical protein
MARKRTPGLRKRGRFWHIDKQIRGFGTLRESTGTGELEEAERYLARRLEEIRQASVYGVRPRRTFREATEHYVRNGDVTELYALPTLRELRAAVEVLEKNAPAVHSSY